MATYKQIVYLILDELKLSSDDAFFNEEHILFMLDKYRAEALSKKYTGNNIPVKESNFQEICMDLESSKCSDVSFCGKEYLKSKKEVPSMLDIGNTEVFFIDYYIGEIAFISKERMRYVGNNKYLKNVIYCSIGPDNHLYFKSANSQYLYLKKAKMKGVFESPSLADELSCNEKSNEIMDRNYPVEEELIPDIIAAILKDLLGFVYNPIDKTNNANDNLPEEAGVAPQQNLSSRARYPRYYKK